MSNNNSDYDWFVEPLNQHTNQVLAGILADEKFHPNLKDEHGIPHRLWLLNYYNEVTYLDTCDGVKFNLFNRIGRFGKLRQVDLLRKPKASQAMRQQVLDTIKGLAKNKTPKTVLAT